MPSTIPSPLKSDAVKYYFDEGVRFDRTVPTKITQNRSAVDGCPFGIPQGADHRPIQIDQLPPTLNRCTGVFDSNAP
jgi:hypothetical protein